MYEKLIDKCRCIVDVIVTYKSSLLGKLHVIKKWYLVLIHKNMVYMKLLFTLLFVFLNFSGFSQKGNEINVDWIKVCKPENRESYFDCLDNLYKKYPQDSTYLHVLFEKAIYYNDIGQADSVVKLSLFGIEEAKSSKSAKAETMQAAFMNLLAAKYYMQGNYNEAVNLMVEALRLHEKNGNNKYASILNFNIGAYHASLKDYTSAKKYFEKSYKSFQIMKDTTYMSASLIAISECHYYLEESEKAKETAELAYELAEKSNYLTAKISYFWITGSLYEKNKDYEKALIQYNKGESLMKTTGIYTNYYLVHFVVGKMKILNEQKKYQQALTESKKLKDVLSDPSITIILHEYHLVLAASYFGVGNKHLAYENLKTAYNLKEQSLSKENKEIVNKLTLEYEAEKKDKEIVENNLKLERQSSEIYKRNLVVIVLALILIILGILLLLLKSRNRYKLRQITERNQRQLVEAELFGELKEQERLSYALHDGIASNLIAIKLQLENQEDLEDFTKTLDLVSETHDEVRKVAHNLMPIDFESRGIVDVIHDFCIQCSTSKLPIHFEANTKAIDFSKEKSLVLYRVVQEFIQNAIKHAQATQIDVLMMQNENFITINIEDNGIGFDLEKLENRKGIKSISERLNKIKGNVTIDSSVGRGTSIFISLKL